MSSFLCTQLVAADTAVSCCTTAAPLSSHSGENENYTCCKFEKLVKHIDLNYTLHRNTVSIRKSK